MPFESSRGPDPRINRELQRLEAYLVGEQDYFHCRVLTAASARPRDGMIIAADNSDYIPEQSDSGATASLFVFLEGYYRKIAAGAQPFVIAGTLLGEPIDGATLFIHPVVLTTVFPANLAGSRFISTVAAAAEAIFTLRKNGVTFGTITFAAGGTVATSTGPKTTVTSADMLTLVAPGTADADLANIAWSILGYR